MKIAVKALTSVTAILMCASTMPALNAGAVPFYQVSVNTTYNIEPTPVAEFAVLMWEDNGDDTVSITGCVPFVSLSVSDYPTSNVFTVFMYKGVLVIPSHINDKPVVAVRGNDIGKGLNIKYVKVNNAAADISDDAFGKDVYVVYTSKENRKIVRQ